MDKTVTRMAGISDLTPLELVDLTNGLFEETLAVVSASRTLKLKTLDDSFSAPLARDLLLSWVSRAMGARSQLLFWMETNEYVTGLTIRTLGQSYTHGSVLLMDLIEHLPTVLALTEQVADLYGLPEPAILAELDNRA